MTPVKRPDRNTRTSPAQTGGSVGNVTESRTAAAHILGDLRTGSMLEPSFDRRVAQLEPRDRHWVQELVWGMLRKRSYLDALLDTRIRSGLSEVDDDLVDLLRLGTYQLLFMGSVPAYAAIAQTVELAKRRHGVGASKLTNAILRRIDRERDALTPVAPTDPIEALAQEWSHPQWLVARWSERWTPAEVARLLKINNSEAPIIVRPYGVTHEELELELEGAGIEFTRNPLLDGSLQLASGVALTELEAFKQGHLFVQDPAASLVAQYASIDEGSIVADLCAAPGGKALELSRGARFVVAADKHRARLERMLVGFGRVDASNVAAFVGDASAPPLANVDAVIVDVPCTGTGTFRRHPDARWRLRISDFAVMGALQKTILRSAASIVKPGGLLVYSTCSLEPEENDNQIASFLADHQNFKLEAPRENSVPASVLDNGYLRVLPQSHDVDGAFAARLRRVA